MSFNLKRVLFGKFCSLFAASLFTFVAGLTVWHIRRPDLHALEGAIFIGSLAIVWLGVSLAH